MSSKRKAQTAPKKAVAKIAKAVVVKQPANASLKSEDLIPVRYIANKPFPETDTILKLDWEHGTVRNVTREQAAHLLYWSDTYEDAREPLVKAKDAITPREFVPTRRHDELDKYPVLVPLQTMDADALQRYSVMSFNEHLPPEMPVEQMRSTILQFMNRPM